MYRFYGTHMLVFGMLAWLSAHLLWLKTVEPVSLLIVLAIVLCSTSFYHSLYSQNYNLSGWIFLPVALWSFDQKQWLFAALAWLCMSMFSSTASFIGGILSLCYGAFTFDFFPVLSFVPAGIVCLLHFLPGLRQGNLSTDIMNIIRLRGMIKGSNRYTRTKFARFHSYNIYLAIIYGQFLVTCIIVNEQFPLLYAVGFGIFIINAAVLRFMDKESITIIILSIAAYQGLCTPSLAIVISLWLAITISPCIMIFPGWHLSMIPPISRPFHIKPVIDCMEEFLAPVAAGERIVSLIPPPENNFYENLFNGWRLYIETPSYVCNLKKVHYLPDWWSINDNNNINGKNLWARTPDEAKTLLRNFPARYSLLYIHDDKKPATEVHEEWQKHDFNVIGEFSWEEIKSKYLGGDKFYAPTMPRLLLMINPECHNGEN